MFKHYFETINGIEVGPLISLAIFITFFIGLFIWIFFLSDKYIQYMGNIPLNDTETENVSTNQVS